MAKKVGATGLERRRHSCRYQGRPDALVKPRVEPRKKDPQSTQNVGV
jgi:hypothetical protein